MVWPHALGVQSQYFEWESPSTATSDSGIVVEQHPSVQGRLRKNMDFWLNELEPSSFVAEIVSVGYCLPFMRLPDPRYQWNHKSALENAVFVADAIQELVTGHCVVKCDRCLIVCSPLSVVTSAKGKKRLVLDLRYLNQFLPDGKFKYKGLNLIPSLFQQGDYLTVFDLKSGCHHADIHEDCWPYLGFAWEVQSTR